MLPPRVKRRTKGWQPGNCHRALHTRVSQYVFISCPSNSPPPECVLDCETEMVLCIVRRKWEHGKAPSHLQRVMEILVINGPGTEQLEHTPPK